MRRRPRLARILVSIPAALLLAHVAAAGSPPVEAATAPIESLYGALEEVAGAGLALEARRERLAPVVGGAFDLEFMAAKVLGRHWRELSAEQQKQWVDLFRRLTVASYAERFDRAEGLSFEVRGAEAGSRGTAVVRSRIHPPGEDPVQVDYRLRPAADGWKVIDVYLNGTVSELALRRSEYATVIERDGFQQLASSLDEKIRSGEAASELPRGG